MGTKIMTLVLIAILGFIAGIWLFLRQPQFGGLPAGEYLRRIEQSPHYANGQFQNLTPASLVTGGGNFISALVKFVFAKREQAVPPLPIPSVKTDLSALDMHEDSIIWLGHSSYFLQLSGKRILIDPVLSPYASPVSFVNKAFPGTTLYWPEDIPAIDYVLISHDHWDHLDYPTMMALKDKVRTIICPLGVGGYFVQWGFPAEQVYEGDWFDVITLEQDFAVHILPARHFSGRSLTRNKTLWAGFALVTPQRRIYYSGDGGYGSHFKDIGDRLGGFDLAIMENGQYGSGWPHIHMVPEETAQAAVDVRAKALLPGHAAKFALATHRWDDPYVRIAAASQDKPYRLLTPMIGEQVELARTDRQFSHWWEALADRKVSDGR